MANITVLALDPQTGDLCFDANGMLMLREDAEAIAQNVRNNLLTWKGEFPLNTDHGTDWERVGSSPAVKRWMKRTALCGRAFFRNRMCRKSVLFP